ncbi:fusaric acid resistance family protein, partial [Vibrio parahaemolyticus V-223/04]
QAATRSWSSRPCLCLCCHSCLCTRCCCLCCSLSAFCSRCLLTSSFFRNWISG